MRPTSVSFFRSNIYLFSAAIRRGRSEREVDPMEKTLFVVTSSRVSHVFLRRSLITYFDFIFVHSSSSVVVNILFIFSIIRIFRRCCWFAVLWIGSLSVIGEIKYESAARWSTHKQSTKQRKCLCMFLTDFNLISVSLLHQPSIGMPGPANTLRNADSLHSIGALDATFFPPALIFVRFPFHFLAKVIFNVVGRHHTMPSRRNANSICK